MITRNARQLRLIAFTTIYIYSTGIFLQFIGIEISISCVYILLGYQYVARKHPRYLNYLTCHSIFSVVAVNTFLLNMVSL